MTFGRPSQLKKEDEMLVFSRVYDVLETGVRK